MAKRNDMKKDIKNKPASTLQRLGSIARTENVEFNSLLLRYFQERLLYRLSISKFSDMFILKGGLLLICLNVPLIRPTKDIDFLGKNVDNDQTQLENIFKDIARIDCDDCVELDPVSIRSERIQEDGDYEGIRLKINVKLGQAKNRLQIDIGFGDVIFPKTISVDFPTLLKEEIPRVKIYSIESVVSEKFEAMIKLGMFNSRMKDFYDIYMLSQSHDFKSNSLEKAIVATLKQRQTEIHDDLNVLSDNFQSDTLKQKQWKAFLRKTRLENVNPDFNKIMKGIKKFLEPVVKSILTNSKMNSYWSSSKSEWE